MTVPDNKWSFKYGLFNNKKTFDQCLMIPYGLSLMKVGSLDMINHNYYSLYQKATVNLPLLNVITLFIEGKPYQFSNTLRYKKNLWVQLYPMMKIFILVLRRARTTDVPHPGASTLISAPRV